MQTFQKHIQGQSYIPICHKSALWSLVWYHDRLQLRASKLSHIECKLGRDEMGSLPAGGFLSCSSMACLTVWIWMSALYCLLRTCHGRTLWEGAEVNKNIKTIASPNIFIVEKLIYHCISNSPPSRVYRITPLHLAGHDCMWEAKPVTCQFVTRARDLPGREGQWLDCSLPFFSITGPFKPTFPSSVPRIVS